MRSPVECQVCRAGYSLQNSVCLANFCARFGTTGVCLECPARFDLVNGICAGKNCSTMDPNTQICLSCMQGYELIRTNPLVYCRASNCQNLDSSLECTNCTNGYFLANNICYVLNCQNLGVTCSSCLNGFTLSNGLCLIANCLRNSTNVCVACAPTYYLQGGSCIKDPRCNRV